MVEQLSWTRPTGRGAADIAWRSGRMWSAWERTQTVFVLFAVVGGRGEARIC